ncbi:MAG: phage tail family protein [Actinomycetota bacterium]|nr:phage tail family protein [Actinomycetota bacterium]
MPYPSPTTYPSALLFPGVGGAGNNGDPVALGNLVLNTIDADGVAWILEEFNWDDSPASSAELTQRARGHGATSSEGFLRSMVYTLAGTIVAPTVALGVAARNALSSAVTLDPFQMTVAEGDSILHSMVKRQDQIIFRRINPTDRTFSIQVAAKDPRKFGDLITATTRLPFSEGGLIRPSTWPRTWTGVSGTGTVTITNAGNTEAPVWARIDGPIPAGGHSITHQSRKQTLTFGTALALEAGEFLTVDMDRKEVLAQGQSPRSGYVTSRGWFSLDPGPNDISFSSVNYSSTASLSLTTKPAFL